MNHPSQQQGPLAEPTLPGDNIILIVDDDPDARELLEDIVASMGFDALTASDGSAALAQLHAAKHTPPRLIMLDLMMPTMDGFAVYTWLRSNSSTRHVPVIVVTALPRNQVDLLRLPGVSAVVHKGDFTVASLGSLIQEVIK